MWHRASFPAHLEEKNTPWKKLPAALSGKLIAGMRAPRTVLAGADFAGGRERGVPDQRQGCNALSRFPDTTPVGRRPEARERLGGRMLEAASFAHF